MLSRVAWVLAALGAALVAGCSGAGSTSPVAVWQAPDRSQSLHQAQSVLTAPVEPATFTYQHLYSFQGPPDGRFPYANLLNVNGTLYVTTVTGGTNGKGAIFAVNPSGTEQVLYSFAGGADGENPIGNLTTVNGTLFGVTEVGGESRR